MPSSRHVRMTRIAISPRFAIRIFCSTAAPFDRPARRRILRVDAGCRRHLEPGARSRSPTRRHAVPRRPLVRRDRLDEPLPAGRGAAADGRARRRRRGRRRADRGPGPARPHVDGARRARRCSCRCCCGPTLPPERAAPRDARGRRSRRPTPVRDGGRLRGAGEVAERPRGRRPQARRDPRRGRRRGRGGRGHGPQRAAPTRSRRSSPTSRPRATCTRRAGRPGRAARRVAARARRAARRARRRGRARPPTARRRSGGACGSSSRARRSTGVATAPDRRGLPRRHAPTTATDGSSPPATSSTSATEPA